MTMQSSRKRAAAIAESLAIPDRLYFKIGDVARICGLETYVLRFWESQFPQLKPNKSGTGQRLYRRRDVEMVLEIKRLVHEEGYTIPGARQVLEQAAPRRNPQTVLPLPADRAGRRDKLAAIVGQARAELREIAGLLSSPDPQLPQRRPRFSAVPGPTGSLFPS
jgi:DNA-binding transcriptional MerR regulator